MIKAIKIRLYPTKAQEILMWKSSGVARFTYNWGLAYLNNYYQEHEESLSIGELRKRFTILRNSDEYPWLQEVSSEIPQQALKDVGEAFDKFFKKLSEYPTFKKKNKETPSFFHLNNKFVVEGRYVKLEKIGYVKMKDEGRLPVGNYKKDNIKVTNPRIKQNGKFWYLSLGLEVHDNLNSELTGESIGVDLGIKSVAVVSNIDKPFKNINKSKTMKRLKKKLKRLQRRVSRKYDKNKVGTTYVKTNNIIRLEKKDKVTTQKNG